MPERIPTMAGHLSKKLVSEAESMSPAEFVEALREIARRSEGKHAEAATKIADVVAEFDRAEHNSETPDFRAALLKVLEAFLEGTRNRDDVK